MPAPTPESAPGAALEPLRYGAQVIDQSDRDAVGAVLDGEWLTQGPAVERFEAGLTRVSGGAPAVAVSSGTSALHLALLALDIGPGSRVLTSANTFLASATAALLCGAEAEFVDIDPATGNLDVELLAQRLRRAPRIDAVVAVHFAGLPADMERLLALKREHGFHLIEDACHALGATYAAGGKAWHPGEHPEVDAAALSFHPVKQITTGEGGAVVSSRADVIERVSRRRAHGVERDSRARPFDDSEDTPPWFAPMTELGLNYRLSDLHAALGASQLARLDAFQARRRELVGRYLRELPSLALFEGGRGLPVDDPGHAWHLFVLHVAAHERDALMAHLARRGIGTQVHYYPVPHQPYFRERYGAPACPRALEHARTALSIPLHARLEDEDQARVVAALRAWRGA